MSSHTITQAQAAARVEQLIHDTAAALTPRPKLEMVPTSAVPNPCQFSDDGLPEKFSINHKYWLRGISQAQHMAISQQVMTRWEQQGHLITATGDRKAGNPDLEGESRPDGFILALVWAEGDDLYLAATSPCIWPNGTPEPAAR